MMPECLIKPWFYARLGVWLAWVGWYFVAVGANILLAHAPSHIDRNDSELFDSMLGFIAITRATTTTPVR